ncbi:hypothetical protein, partial [Azomonas macrocytogenes]|uniref:hypothetical protein n=1 Tax=Azomonas macrocytogenes TaxID=69962 RepID=UPI001C84DA2B
CKLAGLSGWALNSAGLLFFINASGSKRQQPLAEYAQDCRFRRRPYCTVIDEKTVTDPCVFLIIYL